MADEPKPKPMIYVPVLVLILVVMIWAGLFANLSQVHTWYLFVVLLAAFGVVTGHGLKDPGAGLKDMAMPDAVPPLPDN